MLPAEVPSPGRATRAAQWLGLLGNLSLPLVGLPAVNQADTDKGYGPNLDFLHTKFDEEVVEIIHRLDARMFSQFGYKKRTEIPFDIEG